MIIMIVWITFIVLLLTKILFRINKGFGISYTSLILNLCSCVISFIFSRILVNSKITNSLGKSLTEVVVSKVGNLSVFEELSEFIGSIVIGISVFYISYFILSIIMFIIKHLFIYSK